jgi:hypothetical protein
MAGHCGGNWGSLHNNMTENSNSIDFFNGEDYPQKFTKQEKRGHFNFI